MWCREHLPSYTKKITVNGEVNLKEILKGHPEEVLLHEMGHWLCTIPSSVAVSLSVLTKNQEEDCPLDFAVDVRGRLIFNRYQERGRESHFKAYCMNEADAAAFSLMTLNAFGRTSTVKDFAYLSYDNAKADSGLNLTMPMYIDLLEKKQNSRFLRERIRYLAWYVEQKGNHVSSES